MAKVLICEGLPSPAREWLDQEFLARVGGDDVAVRVRDLDDESRAVAMALALRLELACWPQLCPGPDWEIQRLAARLRLRPGVRVAEGRVVG